MNFGENLQGLRERANMTQEALAERLEVSRQSVSKWESGGSFPEMEKLITLCEIFGVDMDTLLRGNAIVVVSQDAVGYEKHQNWMSRMIAGATFLIIFGISLMLFLNSQGVSDSLSTALFMTSVAVAVTLFIVAGMTNDRFEKKNPVIQDFYTEEEKERTHRKSVGFIAGGVAAIVVSVAWFILLGDWAEQSEAHSALLTSGFMLFVGLAVAAIIYGGIQSSKSDIAKWNREHDQSPEQVALRRRVSVVCGCIMMGATVIFLGIGFGFMVLNGEYGANLGWRWGWIVYPLAGIICGIASTIIKRNEPE